MIGRQSVFTATAEHERQLEELLDQLEAYTSTLPGYVLGFRYRHMTNPEELGRISVWRSQDDANNAAQDQHVMSLRSQMMSIAQVHEDHDEHVLDIRGLISIDAEGEGVRSISKAQ